MKIIVEKLVSLTTLVKISVQPIIFENFQILKELRSISPKFSATQPNY